MASEAVPKAYKPWIIGLATILVGSLVILSADVGLAFVSYANHPTPLWVIVVGVLAALGVGLGFGGLFVLMATADFTHGAKAAGFRCCRLNSAKSGAGRW